ncbi:hypothetical protein [Sphingomonas sp. S2-65]|uniref:hypothetical protein n=1 Tax=Sphingomonas sp. S2-65 TaxID=2903960 RepID=UPI001F21DD27|nr:hypothetical protein [Sphingomonas sp. S2-65]UYY57226.1 hypothetical protein LZ586_11060 [Sphingomonas sp. S2-65]
MALSGSVGRGGANVPADVTAVQERLNLRIAELGLQPLPITGAIDAATIIAIGRYQSLVLGTRADGRVAPAGRTDAALSDTSPIGVLRDRLRAQAAGIRLSGAEWFAANEARFPNSNRVADLAPGFATQTGQFLAALRQAGAVVRVSSTLRNRNRAWIMHYAWRIASGEVEPAAVPPNPEVDILWDHGDARASRRAAQAMVELFGIRFKPSITSNHIAGTAIDMTITWDQPIQVLDAAGRAQRIDQPRSGNDNTDLHDVGATYGLHKLATNPPHWSADGR